MRQISGPFVHAKTRLADSLHSFDYRLSFLIVFKLNSKSRLALVLISSKIPNTEITDRNSVFDAIRVSKLGVS